MVRRESVLERGKVFGALVLRPGVRKRSGARGVGQSPGNEQVDRPLELRVARDLLRRGATQPADGEDVCEHLLRLSAAGQSAQEYQEVSQIEAGEKQVDELANPPLVERTQLVERAREVPAEGRVQRAPTVG